MYLQWVHLHAPRMADVGCAQLQAEDTIKKKKRKKRKRKILSSTCRLTHNVQDYISVSKKQELPAK